MAGFSKSIIVGNVGRDPEVRDLPDGNKVANFSVAVTRKWNDRSSNERREETTWFRVACLPAVGRYRQPVRAQGRPDDGGGPHQCPCLSRQCPAAGSVARS